MTTTETTSTDRSATVYSAIEADPYTWPYDGVIDPGRTALIK